MAEFFDYKTQPVTDLSDIFDTTKTGMSYYDQFINKADYMRTAKNLQGVIKYLTPVEYFTECAKIFDSTFDRQVSQTRRDVKTIEHLKRVILEHQRQFPVTFLNYAENTQEGRHRMLVAAELNSWDTEFPVLVIDWHDEERHRTEEAFRRIRETQWKIERAIDDTLRFTFANVEELFDQLQWSMNHAFGAAYNDPDVEFSIYYNDTDNIYTVKKDGAESSFLSSDINWEHTE